MPSLREVNVFPFRDQRKTLLSVIGLYDRSPARVLGVRGQTRTGLFRVGAVAQKVVKYASWSVLAARREERIHGGEMTGELGRLRRW